LTPVTPNGPRYAHFRAWRGPFCRFRPTLRACQITTSAAGEAADVMRAELGKLTLDIPVIEG
jgi:hypothetical protein